MGRLMQKQNQVEVLSQKIEMLSEENAVLEQECRRKDIIIEELKYSIKKIDRVNIDNKIKVFHSMIENQENRANSSIRVNKQKGKGNSSKQGQKSRQSRQSVKDRNKGKKKVSLSFVDSKTQSNTNSLNTSGINSISFSLVSSG